MRKENKSDDIVIKVSKWRLDNTLRKIRELKGKIARAPYYYNEHPRECVEPLLDMFELIIIEGLNKNGYNYIF